MCTSEREVCMCVCVNEDGEAATACMLEVHQWQKLTLGQPSRQALLNSLNAIRAVTFEFKSTRRPDTVVQPNPNTGRLRQEDQIFEAKHGKTLKRGGVGVTGDCRGLKIAPPTDGRMGPGKGQRVGMKNHLFPMCWIQWGNHVSP